MRIVERGGEHITAHYREMIKQKLRASKAVDSILTPIHLRYEQRNEDLANNRKNFRRRAEPISSSIETYFELLVARNAKESAMHLSNPPSDGKEGQGFVYELPDGELVPFESNFHFEKSFFDRKDLNPASVELQSVVAESLQACDVDIRKNVISGIVLAGGNSLIPKFKESFEETLGAFAIGSSKAKLISPNRPSDRKISAWTGASILASTGAFQNMWISKAEYKETGGSILHRKCLN